MVWFFSTFPPGRSVGNAVDVSQAIQCHDEDEGITMM